MDAQRALRRLDVQVLDHPAVVGDDARSRGRPPRPAGCRGRPRSPARSARTPRWRRRPGPGGSASCRRSPSPGPAGTPPRSRRGPSRRCRRRRGSPCRWPGRRVRRDPSPVSSGWRPGTCSAYSSLARSLVPMTSTASRSEADAISSACSIAYGVSTIAHSFVCSGAPCAGHRLDDLEHGVGAVDLGDDDRVGAGLAGRAQVVGVPLGVGAVDPDRQLALAVLTRRGSGAGVVAGGGLGVRGDGVLEVEDQPVARDGLGLLERPLVGAGHVEDAAPRSEGVGSWRLTRPPRWRHRPSSAPGRSRPAHRPARPSPCTA